MTLFVLIYDRVEQKLVELREFTENRRAEAEHYRLAMQSEALRANLDREVIMFQSDSKEALRQSHGSYFLSAPELLERMKDAVHSLPF